MTNEELVRRYYGGDERALEELYRRNLGLIRRIARSRWPPSSARTA